MDEIPDPLSGQVVIGRLTLPRVVVEQAEVLAEARGMSVLQLVRRVFSDWVLEQAPAP